MTAYQGRFSRRLAGFALFAGGLVLGACAPPTYGGGGGSTPWLAAGCIDSTLPGVPDFDFNGTENELNNAVSYDVGGGTLSEDGTCSGTPVETGTIVRADDSPGAIAVCDGVGVTVTDPARLTDYGYAAPTDAWTCVDNPE